MAPLCPREQWLTRRRRPPPPPAQAAAAKSFAATADLQAARFGEHVFKGAVADKYLKKHGESSALLATPAWTEKKSDVVAAAILDWAKDNGASVYCHWCAPAAAALTPRRR